MLEKMITTNRNGMLENISITRWVSRSNQPPKYPIIKPTEIPIKYIMGR